MDYLRRAVDAQLDQLLPHAPAISLDGPKGVGKTATARQRAQFEWILDDPDHRAVVAADRNFQLSGPGTILLDEWQLLPTVWDAVRRAVDAGAPPGRFLLTGSATPRDHKGTHSGAGRILSLRMRPMALHERTDAARPVSLGALLRGDAVAQGSTDFSLGDYFEAITASGFPGIMSQPASLRPELLRSYLHRIIDRDLPEHGAVVRRPETLRRWMQSFAAATSTTASYSRVLAATTAGDGSQPAKTTTIAYRDHLTQLWLIDEVPGWSPARGAFTRLQQAPKHHLADPALAATLLNVTPVTLASPRGSHLAGPLFESLCALSIRVAAQQHLGTRVGHLRTSNGDHEIDFIVEGADGTVVGLEAKLAPDVTERDVRHLKWLRKEMGEEVAALVVLTTGTAAYRRTDGVYVVPLSLFGP